MTLLRLLASKREPIIAEAATILSRVHLTHYEAHGPEIMHQRLSRLFDLTAESVKTRSLINMLEYAREMARERYEEGFDLQEVQTAFNVLEEVLWRLITVELAPLDYPESFGLVSTVLGAGKEALAVEYVSLANQQAETRSLDLTALFRGA
jgi:Zn-dependent M32 family carboxypeptidase